MGTTKNINQNMHRGGYSNVHKLVPAEQPQHVVPPIAGQSHVVDGSLAVAAGMVPPSPGGMAPPPVEIIMSPGPVIQSAGNVGTVVPAGPRYIDSSVTPPTVIGNISESPVAVAPPNGDEAIIQAGAFVQPNHAGDNMIVQQQLQAQVNPAQIQHVQQQLPTQAPPPTPSPQIGGPGMMPMGNQQGMMQPNLAQVQGMMGPYMPPFGNAGNCRFTFYCYMIYLVYVIPSHLNQTSPSYHFHMLI